MIAPSAMFDFDLSALYDGGGDPSFRDVLDGAQLESNGALADLIDADGRCRLARNLPVTLERYLDAVSDLADDPDALDAAIDMSLRSLARTGRADETAVAAMLARHPNLERPIREAAVLNNAIWSTTQIGRQVEVAPIPDLPCDFGPKMDDGRFRYELRELLGEGAFGRVFKAVDRQLSDPDHPAFVAIKVLPGSDRSGADRRRLIDEATKARRVDHPNVVRVLDRGVTPDNQDFIVYEHVEGGELTKWARRRAPVPPRDAAALIAAIARGVHAAHMAGLVHCDLKPNNVLITAAEEAKVADFGVAIRAGERGAKPGKEDYRGRGEPIGNLAFMSPEQFRMEDGALTIPSDIYALGGMLFWLITNELPNGETAEEVARTHDVRKGRSEPPSVRAKNAAIDRDLDLICQRTMAVVPSDRYGSAASLADDLEAWLRREVIPWTKPTVGRRCSLWVRRKPSIAASLVIASAACLAGGITAWHYYQDAQERRMEIAKKDAALEVEQDDREKWNRIRINFRKRMQETLERGIVYEALPHLWLTQWLFGGSMYAEGFDPLMFWDFRVETLRAIIERQRARTGGNDIQTRNWEGALGLWLLRDHKHVEAEPLLRENYAALTEVLHPDDPWLDHVRALVQCATIARIRYDVLFENRTLSESEQAELDGLESGLVAYEEALFVETPGIPIDLICIEHLWFLYGPKILDDPEKQSSYESRLRKALRDDDLTFRASIIFDN